MRSPTTKNASATQVDKFRGLARFVTAHHFGSRPSRIVYKTGGLSNFVFAVKHAEGDFVVRISPDPGRLNAFIKEHWCERAARRAGVPTAEILETGAAIIPFPYVIARSIEGVEGVDHPERKKIICELGRFAAKLHSIKTHGFGDTFDWSNNELSHNGTWKEYFEGEYRYEERIGVLERARVCSPAQLKQLKSVCREMLKLRGKPVLNHGDLRLKNVIADPDGRIRAVIDWEKATSNIAPHWDLSIALHDPGIDLRESFIDGYGIKAKKLTEIVPFIRAFNLLNYVDEINRATEAKDRRRLEQLRSRLGGSFDLYSI